MNQIYLLGRVGKDSELKYTPSGVALLTFSLATHETFKGEKQTQWHHIVLFGKQAESLSLLIKKGKEIFVNGKISSQEWTDASGQKQKRINIIAQSVQVCESRKKETPLKEESSFNLEELQW